MREKRKKKTRKRRKSSKLKHRQQQMYTDVKNRRSSKGVLLKCRKNTEVLKRLTKHL